MPRSKAGKILWAWPEIVAGLDAGWKLKEIWQAAREDGIEMTYKEFTVYVSRIRRRKKHIPPADRERHTSLSRIADEPLSEVTPADPFQNLREQREKKRSGGFEFDPFSDNKSLID
jgi:hypothetical protein